MSDRTFFLGFCWGAAGTTWLARLLNSHEDILCLHAPILPRYDHFRFAESSEIVDLVFNGEDFGAAYPVVGFTHGIASEWQSLLTEKYGDQLRCFAVTRHPIKRIQSTLDLNIRQKDVRLADPTWRQAYADTYQELTQSSGRQFPDDFESLAFYKACKMVNSIIWERQQAFPLYRFEDLVSNEESVKNLVAHVSRGTCQLAAAVVRKMQDTVVRARAAPGLSVVETYRAWRTEHRDAYHHLVAPPALRLYQQLGYELPDVVI